MNVCLYVGMYVCVIVYVYIICICFIYVCTHAYDDPALHNHQSISAVVALVVVGPHMYQCAISVNICQSLVMTFCITLGSVFLRFSYTMLGL